MLIIIWILLIACGILFPRSKILLWFMLSFMIVSIGCRTQGADYISYSLEFQWAATQKLTDVSYPGFVLVAKIAHQYGLSFESFVFTVATFSCVLFYIGIKIQKKQIGIIRVIIIKMIGKTDAIQVLPYSGLDHVRHQCVTVSAVMRVHMCIPEHKSLLFSVWLILEKVFS